MIDRPPLKRTAEEEAQIRGGVAAIIADAEVAELLQAVRASKAEEINDVADARRDRLRGIGRGISVKLGKEATLAQFRAELEGQNLLRNDHKEVRTGFDAYRAERGWPALK